MRVFVTGATGFIGTALTRDLIAHGHRVVGLARSDAAASKLQAAGAAVHRGSLRDPESLRSGAAEADGVIHLAFTFSPQDLPIGRLLRVFLGGTPSGIVRRMMAAIGDTDRAAIDVLGRALSGSHRPLVTTFATMGIAGPSGATASHMGIESDAPDPQSPGFVRAANEVAVKAWAAEGVRASIVRLAPSVHGPGDKGLIPQIAKAACKHREILFAGKGANRWTGVHRDDAATLFRLALEKGRAGGIYHGVGDEGVMFRTIAETIGRRFNLPVRPGTQTDLRRQLGFVAPFVSVDNPVNSDLTRSELGWLPTRLSLAEALEDPGYLSA